MPRKKRCRHICGCPGARVYKPQGIPMSQLTSITLEMDEFEALRLADGLGKYQAQAAEEMGISRQSFGLTIRAARQKVARALMEGSALYLSQNPPQSQEDTHDHCHSDPDE